MQGPSYPVVDNEPDTSTAPPLPRSLPFLDYYRGSERSPQQSLSKLIPRGNLYSVTVTAPGTMRNGDIRTSTHPLPRMIADRYIGCVFKYSNPAGKGARCYD